MTTGLTNTVLVISTEGKKMQIGGRGYHTTPFTGSMKSMLASGSKANIFWNAKTKTKEVGKSEHKHAKSLSV